jgi:DNA-binding CsgD family transcriptional regulator
MGRSDEISRLSDPLSRAVLDSLSAHIAILDADGVIVETNRAWRRYAEQSGMGPDYDGIGLNYLAVCEATEGPEAADAHRAAEGIRQVLSGGIAEFLHDYPCHTPDGRHWYYMRVIRLVHNGPSMVVVSHAEITGLKLAEESLREQEEQLREQKQELEEMNTALKVLLKQRETDRSELEHRLIANLKEMVMPYVEKLKSARLGRAERTYLEILENHLTEILSPFLQKLAAARIFLTPQEIQVASLVREGKTSQEIADMLNISDATVHFHRKNLRKKFGLTQSRQNLRTYLMSLSE